MTKYKPLYALYKGLKEHGTDLPDSYGSFERSMTQAGNAGASNRRNFYQSLKDSNYDVPDTYEKFYESMFVPVNNTTSRARKIGETPMTEEDRKGFTLGAQDIRMNASKFAAGDALRYNKLKQRKQKQRKDFGRVKVGTNKTPYAPTDNVVKDEGLNTYVTSDSSDTTNLDYAQQKQAVLDEQNQAYMNAIERGDIPMASETIDKNGLYDLQENIGKDGTEVTEKGIKEQAEARLNVAYQKQKDIMAQLSAAMDGGFSTFEERMQLSATKNKIDEEVRNLEALAGKESSGFWNTLADVANTIPLLHNIKEGINYLFGDDTSKDMYKAIANSMVQSNWDFGVSDIQNSVKLEQIRDKINKGEAVTKEEKEFLDANQKADKSAEWVDQYGSRAYRWTSGAGVSVPYMIDFYITGGLPLMRGMTQAFGRGAMKIAAKRGWGKLAHNIMYYTGVAAGDIIGSYAMATTVQGLKTGSDVLNRHLGTLYQDEKGNYAFGTFDENGNLLHEGGESFGKALYKGVTAAMLENYTEKMFGHWHLKSGAFDLLDKNPYTKKLADFFRGVGNKNWYLDTKKFSSKFGIGSYPEEVAEEIVNIPLNAWLVGDNSIKELGDRKTWEDIAGSMAISVGSMAGMASTPHIVRGAANQGIKAYDFAAFYVFKNRLNQANQRASEILGDEWEVIKNRIDSAPNENLGKISADLHKQVSEGKYSEEQLDAAWAYIQNLRVMRGYNLAKTMEMQAKAMTGDENTPADIRQKQLNAAYAAGQETEGENKHLAQVEYEKQKFNLASALGVSDSELENMTDEQISSNLGLDDNLDNVIYNYQNAKALYDGIMDNAQNAVDTATKVAAQRVDAMTNVEDGTIKQALVKGTMGKDDYPVYVISGNIETHDDGIINYSDSDSMIIVYNVATGRKETIPVSMLSAVNPYIQNAEEFKAQAVNEAKEKTITELSNVIDGKLVDGSQFTMEDAQGQIHEYKIEGIDEQGNCIISVDGTILPEPLSLDAIQQQYDQSNVARSVKNDQTAQEPEQIQQEAQPIEDKFDYAKITNENDGKVKRVDVTDEEGKNRFPNAKAVFLIQDKGAMPKFVVMDEEGNLTSYVGKRGDKIHLKGEMTIDEYKKQRQEGLQMIAAENADSSMIEENSGAIEVEDNEEGKLLNRNDDGAQTEQNQPSASVTTSQEDAAGSSESKDTNISANGNENNESLTFEDGTPIPVDVNGEVDLSQTDATHAAEWYDNNLGEDADDWLDGEIKKAKKVLEQAKNKKLAGTKPSELVASKKEKEAAIADAQAHYDSAISIRDSLKERRIAKVEDTAEGRKELIEKARRKFARLKSAVKDDAEAVAQIYKETVGTLLHRLYDGTGIDVTDTIPLTAEEHVASNLGAHSLNYEGTETSKGVKQETGLSREDFAKTQLLAADGKGTTIDALVHSLWENRSSNLESLDTQDIRNALIGVLNSGFKASEARNFVENIRIAQAENILEEKKRAQENAAYAEQHKAEPEAELKAKSDEKAELKAKLDNESSNESNDLSNETDNDLDNEKTNDNINDNINTPEVPEDATEENPLGAQRDSAPFSPKDNTKVTNSSEERKAMVKKNAVRSEDVLDHSIGKKMRKSLSRIAKMMGADIIYLHSADSNGWYDEKTNTIYLALDSADVLGTQFVFGHEMTHEIKAKNPAAFEELKNLVKNMMGEDAFNTITDKTQQKYEKGGATYWKDRNAMEEEVVADQIGNWIHDANYAHTLMMKMSHPLLAKLHEIVNRIRFAFTGTEYSDNAKLILRSIEQAYMKTANGQVTNSETGEDVSFSLRQKPEPKKKGIGYKVFVLKDGKLYPPMVANPDGAATPVGVWLDADAAPIAGESKTGRPQVKQGGKGTQGGSGKLAYRPGWHLGIVPYAIQFNRKDAEGNKTLFPKNFVFAEVEYAADVDYQEEARQEGINPSGKYQHSLAGLKHLPTDGYYMYRTNPNPETDPWVITGAMKVNRILTRAEQAELVKNAGREPQQIQEGDIVTDDVVNSINQEIADAPKFSLKDNQENPLNQDGTLKLDKIKSVDELTDEDFTSAFRNVELPAIPKNVDAAIGANGKPIVIKKNIFEKNWNAHKFTPAESKKVLNDALYNTDLVGHTQPTKKPNHWVAIKLDDKSPITVLEVNDNKDNVEVVGWYTLDERNLGRIKRQAERNGGELIMLTPKDDKVESLSTPPLSSAAKIDNSSETAKENGEKFSLKDEKIKSVAEKFGVNEDDVAMYANAVEKGSTAEAARARANIKRYLMQVNEGNIFSFKDVVKYTKPINEALKQNFGDLDAMIEERRKHVEAERNAMEAARKRAEEEEAKRKKHLEELSLIPDDKLDKQYMDALAKGDDATAREMLDAAARRKGYDDTESAYQGVGAWAAPGNPGYESDKARRDDWESSGSDVNLEDMALGYTPQPDDYFSHPERYSQNTPHGLESVKAINTAIDAIKNGEKDVKVKVYRAVPTSVKEGKLRNGDWVTPSKKYADIHGNNRLDGKYRIIEDEVPANQLWWDGNDANEFGFDDGKEYRYKNAKNNRKLNDIITYDNKGNVIPPSKRFNSRKNDIRFSLAGERGAAAADKAEERTARMDNLSVARKMEEEKKDAKAIKIATGWERGADGKWRYEMPDAKIKDTMDVGGGHIVKRYEDDMLWNGGKLFDVIDAPELFKAYPQLKGVRIDTDAIMNDMPSHGEYDSKTNTITIHADELKYMNDILNHEIQHAIQGIEGFATGGSPTTIRGEVKKRFNEVTKQIKQLRAEGKEDEAKALIEKNRGLYDAYMKNDDFNSYKSLAGEVEARNVQERMNITPEERRKTLAESTEDVARKDQIFLGVGDVSFSLRDMADGKESGAADMAEDLKSLNTPDEVDDAIKTAIEDMPSGWKMANKKMIHIAQALGENRKAEIAGEEPKFSLKDGTLIKAGTYFSGGGLVEEGLKGIIDPVVAVEYDEKISGVYRNNFGQHIVTADVRDVDPKELVKQIDGEVEYFHASPVCKNYSQAKSNHAEVELDKETAASTAEFINAVKPRVVTIENVKGYKDSDAMKIITDALDANGYTWDADVYNAADYGGYTNRERLIVRAVRDGKLPEKPKKIAHKSGWYEAVADIIPTLTEKKNGVAPWMDIRLKADGIDWRNIDKPLYVMGSAYADGKVPHAFADELLPTLRTKSGDVIVMPDGKVYRAMGRVLARVSGVSDDYKMPFSESLSHTIIGNGIPTQLTEHVIAPLLTGSDPKFSIRTYHGTGASFDKFDLSHALEGEGSETFGHGVYVTNSSKIGREYAQRAKQRKMADLYKNMRYPDGVKDDIFKRRVFGEMVNDVATGGSVASAKEFAKKRVGADANDIQRTLENLKDREKGTEYEQNLKDRLAEYKDALKWIDSIDEDYLTQGNANRYDVDIPDDNGNYLGWNDSQNFPLEKWYRLWEITHHGFNENEYFKDGGARYDKDRIERIIQMKLDSPENGMQRLPTLKGEELYHALEDFFDRERPSHGAELASRALSEIGFVGIKYPAGLIHGGAEEGDYNYVIFDENNANIVGNTRFSLRGSTPYGKQMEEWMEKNHLEKSAVPMEKPIMKEGENIFDYANRMVEWTRNQNLWKTAPKQTGFQDALDKWKADNGLSPDAYPPVRPHRENYSTEIGYAEDLEEYNKKKELWKSAPKPKNFDLSVDLEDMNKQLRNIRRAVLNQKNYDQRTVKAVSDLVRKMLNIGWGDGLSRGKVGNLLSAAKNATGANDVKKYLDKAMGILAENYLNRLSTAYDNLINTKGARADQSGVIKMGSLDAKGQAFMSEYKKAMNMDDKSLNTYIANIEEDSAKNEDNVEMNDYRLAGIQAAIMYKQQIGGNDADIAELKRQIDELNNKKNATKEDKDLLKSLGKKLFENKFDRITMYENLLNNIQKMVKESKGRAKEFREEIAEHKNEILHRANLDLEGMDSTYYDTTTAKKKLVNNDLQRAVFSSTYTFEQFLKFFGKKAANGEGYLYNYFTKLNQDALDEEQLYNEMNRNALDEKTKELFGKEKFMKLVGIDGKGMKEMDVEVTDYSNKETGKRTIHLKQGQMLYIYLVNKETDGEMKLRAMGITEEDVAAIEENLDPRVKAMGEWLQDEYLPECQRRYQATHTKYFGAPMKEVENYFPLAINNRARNVKEDVNQDSDAMSQLAGTSTGAIVTRRVNVIPLDIENADAFEVAFNHLQEMEEWSAMLPFRQDINTLLSYTHFRNQVQNMSSVAYGSGKTLWDEFKQTAQIAAGTYKPKVNAGMMDSRIAAAMGGIAVAKISGRLWTAIKQSQSATVFLPECDFTRFVKNGVNPYGSWKWAMENIPDFRKRVENMTYGDVKLRQYLDELEKWHDWTKTISKIGMAPNILVDGITCAVGARSVYETEVNRLTKLGYPKEKAEEKAYYKAVAAYNKTQQSSGGMYLSPMQVDRTYVSAALSLFKNANYAYGRMQIEACRGLARTYDLWGGKHKTTLIESMTRQIMEEDGLDENTARAIAKATYNRTFRQSIGRLINFATLVPVSWALYKVLPYLLTGDDDDKKKDMIEEAVLKGFATSLSDNYVIPFVSNILNAGLKVEDGKPTFDPEVFRYQNLYINPATSDLANIYSMIGNQKWYSVANKLGMLGVQSLIGFNPETVGALYQAVSEADYDNGNTAKEWQIGILKAISAPEESIRELYMDELGLKSGDKDAMKKLMSLAGLDADDINKVPLAELEKRYAERQINRDNLLSQIGMDAETFNGYVDKYQKSFEKKIKDKMDKWDEYDKKKADEFFDTTSDPKLKDMIEKKRAKDANAAADEQIAKEGLNQEKKGKEPSEEAYDAVKMSIDVAEDNAISTYNKVLNKRYAALNDEYNNQTDAMKYIFMSKHPNFKAYKELESEYTKYGKKIKELKEKLVSADGYDVKQTILKQIRAEREKFSELQSKVR
jgi:site-specific DNA-cytosine methylase